jgi:hypothetical protein
LPFAMETASALLPALSLSSACPRVRRRVPNGSSAVIVSSGGSDDSDPVEVDFCGEPALLKYLELRSGRPEMLEVVDEICDCDWVARALEDRLGSVAAILCCGCRSDRANVDRV